MAGKHFLPEVGIDGYTLFHRDREGRRGGGIALYVRNNLNSYINTTIKTDRNTESLWIDVITGGKKFVVGLVYRPPDLDGEASAPLLQEIEKASRYNNVCIMGDFNYRGIDWDDMTGDRISEEFLNVVQDGFFKQLVREPTRQGNILDLVLTNSDTLVSQVEIGARFDVSDHNEIRFRINAMRKVEQNTTLVPDFRKANYQGLKYHLRNIDWEEISMGEDPNNEVEMQYNRVVREILNAQEQYIPKRRIRSNRNDPKWMNNTVKRDIGLKRGLYRRIKRGETHVTGQYNELARKVKKDIRTAKRNYEVKIARDAQKDPKGFYQLYKAKACIGPLKGGDGKVIDSDEGIT